MGNPHLKRDLLPRWEAEQKALEDNQQQNEQQPLQQQQQDQPHPQNQEVEDQAAEIEPDGSNANEDQGNSQIPTLLEWLRNITTQGLTPRSNENQPSPEQSAGPALSFEEWLKSQTPSDELTESSSSMATGQANSPQREVSAKSETYTSEKGGDEENLKEGGRKKARTKSVGHITEGCKGKPFWKHDKDSDSSDDDFSFPVKKACI